MDIKFSKNRIEFKKELNNLDKFVIDFVSVLDKLNIKYVLISGYVSILFGRSRSSEDIDIFVEKISFEKFKGLWKELSPKFECIITEDQEEAYKEYLMTGHAIRFSYKKQYIPNMEVKFAKSEFELISFQQKIEVILNGIVLYVSPLELQIAVKLRLGSQKDIEDAVHLYELFKKYLNIEELQYYNKKLGVESLFNKHL